MLSLQAKWCTCSIDTFFHIPYHYTTIITTCQINKQSQARIELWIIFTFIFLVKACQFDHFSCCKGTHKYKLRNSCVLPPWILTANPPKRLTMVCLSILTYPYAYSDKRILQNYKPTHSFNSWTNGPCFWRARKIIGNWMKDNCKTVPLKKVTTLWWDNTLALRRQANPDNSNSR